MDPKDQRIAELESVLVAIHAVNVNEFGYVADEAIDRLIKSVNPPPRMHAAALTEKR